MPREVFLSMKSFVNICTFSAQYASNYILKAKWAESMGYLFCRRDGDRYIIGDAVGMTRGGETYVTMTPDDLAKIEKLDAERPEYFLGGWFHTHPGLSPFYSETDVINQLFYQAQNEDGLGLVFDHSMVSPDFIGFKFFRVNDPQDPNTRYHEVPWKPLAWNEEGLQKALQPLGISSKVIEGLAVSLGLRSTPLSPELPPFLMPKVKDKDAAKQMVNNIQTTAQAAMDKGDHMQAIITKRIQVNLLRDSNDTEMRGDALIDFLTWCIMHDKILTAEEYIGELELMVDDHHFPDEFQNYYAGKAAYIHGVLFQKQLKYANAIESYQKCISPFEAAETYEEDCAKAQYHIAECLEFQKELKLAQEALQKAQIYVDDGIKRITEEGDLDEDEEAEVEGLKRTGMEITRFSTKIKAVLAATVKGPVRIV
jgi:tetratricopeptide (TPR) repeat protein